MLKKLFSRKWIITTLLAIAAAIVMARLGFWQLDRLEQRRAFNQRVVEQIDAPQLALDGSALDLDLGSMEFRSVIVRGDYQFSNQVSYRNQVYYSRIGVHLLTPLKISGTEEWVLVDRGWIPAEDSTPEAWEAYDQPGEVEINGVIRRSQTEESLGRQLDPPLLPGQTGLDAWNMVNLERIGEQIPGIMTTVYIHQTPQGDEVGFPAPVEVGLELDEGPHLGYAIQWFLFATALVVGYPFYVRNQERRATE